MENGIIKYIRYVLNCIKEVIYPYEDKCIICDEYTREELICNVCKKNIRYCNDSLTIDKEEMTFAAYPSTYYSGVMVELILRLKYKSDFGAGEVIGNIMIDKILNEKLDFDYITFVPSGKEAYKKRGYNQSEYLSKVISDKIHIPMISCLYKVKKTKDQIGLSTIERWENVKDSFNVINNNKLYNKNILLIDDVLTTGATVFYCASKIKKSGAKNIYILTAAKSNV
ncbi:ComF family protein [Clostridium niameyense]|uniref:ComF family protein n=1 Tax=Clostridium niameyense TaxID=1622073 RepID=A0A6M0RBL4_9CLOT|nr:ComF family protein [Clostridium niameyense]NEZ47060.1 ComF family protein [Clostridium niameyense]